MERAKTRLCAERLFQQQTQKPILFLRLPTPSTHHVVFYAAAAANEVIGIRKPVIGRLWLWTDGQTLSHLGHVPEGFGTMKPDASLAASVAREASEVYEEWCFQPFPYSGQSGALPTSPSVGPAVFGVC